MADAIPEQLVSSVPVLMGVAVLLGVFLTFLWRLASMYTRESERRDAAVERLVDRHEKAEEKQFATIDRLADAVEKKAAAVDGLSVAVNLLSDSMAEYRASHPAHTHKELQAMSHVIHPGVPGGEIHPIEMDPAEMAALGLASETRPWPHALHGVDEIHDAGATGHKDVLLAVLDTGVDADHPDLKPVVDVPKCRSFTGEPLFDGHGHGCHVTGTAAAALQGSGIAGVAPDCTVVHYKVLTNRGSGGSTGIAAAIRAVADLPGYKAKVISGSFGAGGEDPAISNAVRYAYAKGVHQVYAAGNSGPRSPNWPGMLPECVAVAACGRDGNVAAFSSSYGDYVDVTAGGVDVPSTMPGGRYAVMSGTSMATPCVGGIEAAVLGEVAKAGGTMPSPKEFMDCLFDSCEPYSDAGKDERGGYGRVNAVKFLAEAKKRFAKPSEPKPEPKPEPVDPPPADEFRVKVPSGTKRVVLDLA